MTGEPAMPNTVELVAIAIIHVILILSDAGWSSPVARRAHNPKVVGSNPAPATTFRISPSRAFFMGLFLMLFRA